MVIIQNEDEMLVDAGDVVEQRSQQGFRFRWLRGLERHQHTVARAGFNFLQSRDEISQKARGIVISFI